MSYHHHNNQSLKIFLAIAFCVIIVSIILLCVFLDNNRQLNNPVDTSRAETSSSVKETTLDNNQSETEPFQNYSPKIINITQIGTHAVALTFSAEDNEAKEFIIEKAPQDGKGKWSVVANTTNNYYYDTYSNDTAFLYRIGVEQNGKMTYSDECEVGYQAKPTVMVACLMYHYFATPDDIKNGALNNDGTIMVDELEGDLKYLHDNNIRTITCSELLDFINGKITLPEKCVMISVDDGHYSVYKYMIPLLQKYNCKATISIIGDFADNGESRTEIPQNNYWMKWDEIKEISKLDCIEIGSHTYSLHQLNTETGRKGTRILAGESIENYTSFLTNDDTLIRTKLNTYNINPEYFAFPYNDPCAQARLIYGDNLGYKLLMVGDSDYFVKEKANCYIYGIGDDCLETNLIRRIARHKGDSIVDLIDSIYDNREYKQE